MIDHKDALNLMLANACQSDPDPDGTRNITVSMHCVAAHFKAKLLHVTPIIEYEIVSVTFTDI